MSGMQDDYWENVWLTENPMLCAGYLRGHMRAKPEFLDVFRRHGVTTVCDAACGFGAYGAMFAANGYAVSLFDIAKSAVELAQSLFRQEGLSAVAWRVCSLNRIGYADAAFSAVCAHAVLDHLAPENARLALVELIRITKPGGLIYLSFDPLEADDLSAPHDLLPDGGFLYTDGIRKGLLFYPYNSEAINTLLSGYKILYFKTNTRGEQEIVMQTPCSTPASNTGCYERQSI